MSTWQGWPINRPAWFDYMARLPDKSAKGLPAFERQKLMFIYTWFSTYKRIFNFLVLCFKNCVYTLALCCGWWTKLPFSARETWVPKKTSAPNSKHGKKTPCQVKVSKTLSPYPAEGVKNSAAKGLIHMSLLSVCVHYFQKISIVE